MEAGESDGPPDTGAGEWTHRGLWNTQTDEAADELSVSGLLEQNSARQNELDGVRLVADLVGAGASVAREIGGRGLDDISRNRIVWIDGEDLGGQRGDVGFAGVLDPSHPFFRSIGLEPAEEARAERREAGGTVEVPERIAEGTEADIVTAAAIAEEMAPAAGLSGSSAGSAPVATGASPTEDQDPGRGQRANWMTGDSRGHEGRFEVVGGVARDGWPRLG